VGCTAKVEATDDSVRFDAEVPKIERGDRPLDADLRTDEGLDVDTLAPGDRRVPLLTSERPVTGGLPGSSTAAIDSWVVGQFAGKV